MPDDRSASVKRRCRCLRIYGLPRRNRRVLRQGVRAIVRIETIVKIVAGDNAATLDRVAAVYDKIIDAGIYRAASIKVAEGAKVLENTQRDVNIALMNEVAQICDKVGIATEDVINAASTKWNFMPFTPGLVGGHCIGVDPYYLAALAETVGMRPELILAGRRINDGMVDHVVNTALRLMLEQRGDVFEKRIAIYGITFKEDVPDTRNSKVVEVVDGLRNYGFEPQVHDLHCSQRDADILNIPLSEPNASEHVDLMILLLVTVVERQPNAVVESGQMFSIAPIGSCRISTPLRLGQEDYGYALNKSRNYGYCHSPAEAVQMARFMLGKSKFPKELWPLIARGVDYDTTHRAKHAKADLYIVELSSAKEITIDGICVQLNYLTAAYRSFFENSARARHFWEHAAEGDQIAIDINLNGAQLSPEDIALLRRIRLNLVTEESLAENIALLRQMLPNVMFVTHVNARREWWPGL